MEIIDFYILNTSLNFPDTGIKKKPVSTRVLTRTVCANILSMIGNRKKIQNLNKKFEFKI